MAVTVRKLTIIEAKAIFVQLEVLSKKDKSKENTALLRPQLESAVTAMTGLSTLEFSNGIDEIFINPLFSAIPELSKEEVKAVVEFGNYCTHHQDYRYNQFEHETSKNKDFNGCLKIIAKAIHIWSGKQVAIPDELSVAYAKEKKIDYNYLKERYNNLRPLNKVGKMLEEFGEHTELAKTLLSQIKTTQEEKANLSEQVKSKDQVISSLEQEKRKLQTAKTQLESSNIGLENEKNKANDSYQKLQSAIKQWRQWSLIACLLALLIGGGAGWFLKPEPVIIEGDDGTVSCNNNTIKSKVESLFSQIASGNEKAKQDLIELCESPNTEVVQQISAVNIVKQGEISHFTTKINANMKVAAVVTDSTDCKITRIFYIE